MIYITITMSNRREIGCGLALELFETRQKPGKFLDFQHFCSAYSIHGEIILNVQVMLHGCRK